MRRRWVLAVVMLGWLAACGVEVPSDDASTEATSPSTEIVLPVAPTTAPVTVNTEPVSAAAPTTAPTTAAAPPPTAVACHPAYTPCVPPAPPDLDCPDIGRPVQVDHAHGDPHKLDRDGDGRGCESQGG